MASRRSTQASFHIYEDETADPDLTLDSPPATADETSETEEDETSDSDSDKTSEEDSEKEKTLKLPTKEIPYPYKQQPPSLCHTPYYCDRDRGAIRNIPYFHSTETWPPPVPPASSVDDLFDSESEANSQFLGTLPEAHSSAATFDSEVLESLLDHQTSSVTSDSEGPDDLSDENSSAVISVDTFPTMDRREILSKGSALQKAIASREPTANIINILNDLKVNIKPTEELLRATGIGKVVNKVKGVTTVDPSVQQLASEIISRWRHVVNEQKIATSGASTPNGARSNGTSSPAPVPTAALKAASPGIDPSKRNWKTDKVPRDECTNDTVRNNSIGLLYDGLAAGSDKPMTEILEIAKSTESAVFGHPEAKKTINSFYKDKIRSLYQNLKNKSNPTLRARILSGAITPAGFAKMSPEEMKSAEMREEDARLRKENLNNAMTPQEAQSISSSIECPKCHKKTVSYTQAQTRSADEPMTNFCECQSCGNRWKFS